MVSKSAAKSDSGGKGGTGGAGGGTAIFKKFVSSLKVSVIFLYLYIFKCIFL